ncbi:MAG: hypothetical protein HC882_03370 [Acidobacteria bacterium]|nr:hypothetical protein [Acidobacteriota bacterium]
MATSKKGAAQKGKEAASWSPSWLGPTVLIGGAILLVVLFVGRMLMTSSAREERDALEHATRVQAPALRGYPDPRVTISNDELASAESTEAAALEREHCEWWIAWSIDDPPVETEILLFEKAAGAEHAWKRAPQGSSVDGVGYFSIEATDGGSLWFRRGRLIGRVWARPGTPAGDGALAVAARELDMAVVRTFGAEP